MKRKTGKLPWRMLAILGALLFGLALSGCALGDVLRFARSLRESRPRATAIPSAATPTRLAVRTLAPLATATLRPSATPTAMSTPTPTQTATRAPGLLRLDRPSFSQLQEALTDLEPGDRFQLVLDDKTVTTEAATYLQDVEMPLTVRDLKITFEPGQVKLTAQVPLGFFNVGASATGVWRAVDCAFEAALVDLRVAGQPAPATLRDQVADALASGLATLAEAPVCFTDVILRNGEVEIIGYRE